MLSPVDETVSPIDLASDEVIAAVRLPDPTSAWCGAIPAPISLTGPPQ